MTKDDSTLALSLLDRLRSLEEQFERGMDRASTALLLIHHERAYLATHSSFEAYCRERWGYTRQHAYRLIEYAGVVLNLENNDAPTPADVTPGLHPQHPVRLSERQYRALKHVPVEIRQDALREAIETSPNGNPPTAAHLEKVAAGFARSALSHHDKFEVQFDSRDTETERLRARVAEFESAAREVVDLLSSGRITHPSIDRLRALLTDHSAAASNMVGLDA
jgi:hypothetical protein